MSHPRPKIPLRRTWIFSLGLTGCLGALLFASGETKRPADRVFLHGAVYTVDAARRWADAVAIEGGRIVYVGTDEGARAFVGPSTRVVDLAGKMLLPGFRDSHVHPLSGGVKLGLCNLSELTTREQVFAAIQRCAATPQRAGWVLGSGWELPLFPAANPSRLDLDRLVPNGPAYFSAADGHSAWVNSAALRAAGIDSKTPDPPHGRIERDPAGEPSGTLRESAAHLVSAKIPGPDAAESARGLRRGLAMAADFGITGLLDASADEADLRTYHEVERAGGLPCRVAVSLHVDPAHWEEQLPTLLRLRSENQQPRLRVTGVKIFADGVIESGTAALLEPYLNRPGDRGTANLEPELWNRLATRLDREGFQIHVHAIGDRAVRITLDALQAAEKANGRRDARHHIAHLELVDPADIPRFERLRVAANFQMLWAFADNYITDLTEPVLGKERSRWLYPIGSVARTGAALVGGSDWPVSSMNPLEAIQVAVTRRDPTAPVGAAWIPEERIDLPAAIAAYTIAGAWLEFEERETGSIEVGKAADLVVLDRNLFEIPAEQIHSAKVLLTLLEGKETFRDPGFASQTRTPPRPRSVVDEAVKPR